MAETTLTSPNGRIRVLTRPDYEQDGSDVTHIEMHDLQSGTRLVLANLSRPDLKPIEVLSPGAALLIDAERNHWWMRARPLTLERVTDLDALRARYASLVLRPPGRALVRAAGAALLATGALSVGVALWPGSSGSGALLGVFGAVFLGLGAAIVSRVQMCCIDPGTAEICETKGWPGALDTTRVDFASITAIRVDETHYRGAPNYSVVADGAHPLALHRGSYEREKMLQIAQQCADLIGCSVVRGTAQQSLPDTAAVPAPRGRHNEPSTAAPLAAGAVLPLRAPKAVQDARVGANGPALQTLAVLSTHCAQCGGGAAFTGLVLETQRAPRKLEAITWCARCETESTYWTEDLAALIARYDEARSNLADAPGFDAVWHAMRTRDHAGLVEQRLAAGLTLPLLPPTQLGISAALRMRWVEAMLYSDAWCPQPSVALRVSEVLTAAVNYGDDACLAPVIACKAQISDADMARALGEVETSCGPQAARTLRAALAQPAQP